MDAGVGESTCDALTGGFFALLEVIWGCQTQFPFQTSVLGLKRDPSLAVLVLGAASMGWEGDGLPCWSRELLSTLFSRVSCCPLVWLFPGLPTVGRRPSLPPLQRQPWLSDKGGD